jgi:AAA15 family ATPase/GTPase
MASDVKDARTSFWNLLGVEDDDTERFGEIRDRKEEKRKEYDASPEMKKHNLLNMRFYFGFIFYHDAHIYSQCAHGEQVSAHDIHADCKRKINEHKPMIENYVKAVELTCAENEVLKFRHDMYLVYYLGKQSEETINTLYYNAGGGTAKVIFLWRDDETSKLLGHEQLPFILGSPKEERYENAKEIPLLTANGENILRGLREAEFRVEDWLPKIKVKPAEKIVEARPAGGVKPSGNGSTVLEEAPIKSLSIENLRSLGGSPDGGQTGNPTTIADLDSAVTIIHGENGIGKTTILEAFNLVVTNCIPYRDKAFAVARGQKRAYVKATSDSVDQPPPREIEAPKPGQPPTATDIEEIVGYLQKNLVFYNDRAMQLLIDDTYEMANLRIGAVEKMLERNNGSNGLPMRFSLITQNIDKLLECIEDTQEGCEEAQMVIEENLFVENAKSGERSLRAVRFKWLSERALKALGQKIDNLRVPIAASLINNMIDEYKNSDSKNTKELSKFVLNKVIDAATSLERDRDKLVDSKDYAQAKQIADILAMVKATQTKIQAHRDNFGEDDISVARGDDIERIRAEIEALNLWTQNIFELKGYYFAIISGLTNINFTGLISLRSDAGHIFKLIEPRAQLGRLEIGFDTAGGPLFRIHWDNKGGEAVSSWHQLSAGQRSSLGLAIFLANARRNKGQTYLLDEAFLHLDEERRANAFDAIRAIAFEHNGKTRFVITTADEYFLNHALEKLECLAHAGDDKMNVQLIGLSRVDEGRRVKVEPFPV